MHTATIYGEMEIAPDARDLISRVLILHGEWAYAEALLLAPLIETGDVLFDAGAYLGTFSLGLAGVSPLARVVAVEANPAVVPLLRNNLATNAAVPAEVAAAGVARKPGWLELAEVPADNLGAAHFSTTTVEGTIPARSLQQLRTVHGDYTVLKLDVEGFERDALLGDADYIRAARPVIFAECNEVRSSLELLSALVWLGYEPVYLAYSPFRSANFKGSAERIYPLAYEAALLAAPRGRLARLTAEVSGEEVIHRRVQTAPALRRAMWDTPRWAQEEWVALPRPVLIARLGRAMRGQRIGNFI